MFDKKGMTSRIGSLKGGILRVIFQTLERAWPNLALVEIESSKTTKARMRVGAPPPHD